MRIVCPSCNAQYEIDVSLLPDEGREVQCSTCGNIWFQEGPAPSGPQAAQPAPPPAAPPPPQSALEEPEPEAPVEPEPDEMPRQAHASQPADETEDALESDDPAADEEPLPSPRSAKPVDPKVLDILRDEAEFEATQRAREASGLETQPELGLLGAAPWPSKPDAPDAAHPAQDDDVKSAQSASAFPDIDDISESLEPIGRGRNKKTEFEVPATSDAKKRSFLSGLMLPVALALILVALYLAAPSIIGAVPATEPALMGYVSTVDGMRGAILNLLGL